MPLENKHQYKILNTFNSFSEVNLFKNRRFFSPFHFNIQHFHLSYVKTSLCTAVQEKL